MLFVNGGGLVMVVVLIVVDKLVVNVNGNLSNFLYLYQSLPNQVEIR